MVDDSTKAEPSADAAHSSPVGDSVSSAPTGAATTTQQVPSIDTPQKDVVMPDAPIENAASPAPASFAASSPAPARTGTPVQGSRAPSVHPDPGFSMPSDAPPHGDSTRRYLNTKVTGVLLEGMKQLAKDQPTDPLRVLGEYLIQKSKELEGTT